MTSFRNTENQLVDYMVSKSYKYESSVRLYIPHEQKLTLYYPLASRGFYQFLKSL